MNRIRALRRARGWTQQQLAQAAGCGQSFLSEIETGKANPTQAMLEAIAAALGVPVSQLFVEDPTPDTASAGTSAMPIPPA
ncbi:MAG: helix-turn-helix domain-containing protein [Firmicutes bacterium]|nr:helix-turn-helix domain-containing protein [Bacillota bacterium]